MIEWVFKCDVLVSRHVPHPAPFVAGMRVIAQITNKVMQNPQDVQVVILDLRHVSHPAPFVAGM